jgi:serine/threonine-protein kinase
MAEVHLARQRGPRQFEKLVVVKVVHPRVATQQGVASMLLDEARIAALVKHPNCVDVYDLGEEDGTFFIAMEYLEGESLAAVLRASQQGPRLDPFSTAKIISECASGLHAAHELRGLDGEPLELVHQDVTPGNVFILYTGQVKLVDFGVATIRTMGESDLVRGKAGYLAPELLDGARASRRTDVFALGVVLWEALTLRRLFWAQEEDEIFKRIRTLTVPPPSSLAHTVVRDLDDVCLRALDRDPDKRFPTAEAMRDELTQVLRHASWAGGDGPLSRYMQSTFEGRIKARQHLLRELAATRSPRSDTVERIQEIHDSGKHEAPQVDAGPAIGAHGAVPRKPTHADGSGGTPVTGQSVAPGADDAVIVVERGETPRRRRLVRGAIAALLIAGGAAGAVMALGGGSPSGPVGGTAAAAPAPKPAPPTTVRVPVLTTIPVPVAAPSAVPATVVPPPPSVAGSGSGSGSGSDQHHHHHHDERVAVAPPPGSGSDPAAPTAETAKSLYKQGLQDFVSGSSAQAIDKFHQALAKDGSFAPAYRGMGMAYERMGDRPHAAAAYRKYLALDPGAADAAQIKTRLEGLQ